MEILLSILGSLASIGGAIWAYVQARRSKTFAEQAKTVRDELVERRKTIEVSKVHSETARILRLVSKVGPTCTSTSVKTIRCHEIAQEVEEYTRLLNEQSSHFTHVLDSQARKLCGDLKEDIVGLAEAIDFESKKKFGTSIYYKIDDFMPLVKMVFDEKKERQPIVAS
ncbi:hypothetical protein [Halomonas sp. TD01]|uniref:hypothetical protein n=1 Tax=Halomonas sp. TD01 TaxID=999141 RepID=UPI000214F4E1|nr:hypothetical protein [Halomonas sp. TD01]EGP20597.1 hypothetical protein GME_05755 [Halomonas sp. TD01]CAH1041721.1 hypothetical protein HPTD01_199 [Halomonas sp. TD01]